MKEQIAEASLPFKARIAGVLYLIIIIGGLFGAGYVPVTIVVYGDAAATINNVLTNESLYRFGLGVHIKDPSPNNRSAFGNRGSMLPD